MLLSVSFLAIARVTILRNSISDSWPHDSKRIVKYADTGAKRRRSQMRLEDEEELTNNTLAITVIHAKENDCFVIRTLIELSIDRRNADMVLGDWSGICLHGTTFNTRGGIFDRIIFVKRDP